MSFVSERAEWAVRRSHVSFEGVCCQDKPKNATCTLRNDHTYRHEMTQAVLSHQLTEHNSFFPLREIAMLLS